VTLHMSGSVRAVAGVVLALCHGNAWPLTVQSDQATPQPMVVQLNEKTTDYQEILAGPPQTASMESGLVVLGPGKSGEQHSTKGYEEVLVVLSGSGELVVSGGGTLQLVAHSVAYCPTATVHNIRNVGRVPLRYVYIAAKAVK